MNQSRQLSPDGGGEWLVATRIKRVYRRGCRLQKRSSFQIVAKSRESNMVEWSSSERSTLAALWGKINPAELGPQALARLLIVYPWTTRYFGKFGDLSSPPAIQGNPKVVAHGKTVLGGVEQAMKNLDDVKGAYTKLSQLHSEKLNVDPDNFRLLGDCITICLAMKAGAAFTPEAEAVWQKFMCVVANALSTQYF